ncbi:dicarboxylate/amino acid:cation symporter [Persicobacter sp. CCB-QB2]|uniref:dicarboxylate/amino acid:cation symporter n=1 Tax=Persicobacter sp. CCB-QB2 TaxID=1561025 RepID=UPI0006A99CDF|nr:dicarboxylate/amino acid:cation symporter [Persicobacter sp. CCB-QB2]
MFKKIPLHSQIFLGLILGLVVGLTFIFTNVPQWITLELIKPIGEIFVRALKMVAAPLVIASLICGIANLSDISKLSRMGTKTIGIYILTTTFAITIGLVTVNLLQPGKLISPKTRSDIEAKYSQDVKAKKEQAEEVKEQLVLQPLIEMVPENFVKAASENSRMLQVVFFAVLFGVALLKIPENKRSPVVAFFDGLNHVVLKIIDFIMIISPYGVFSLICTLLVEVAGDDPNKVWGILKSLGFYALTVIIGLLIMVLVVYPMLLRIFTRKNFSYKAFFKGIERALLLAFSSSSSAAALPITIECVEKEFGVSEEVSSFVLPLGATMNMDGTSLYQAVAAVFISHALGYDLSLGQQLTIVFTALLASIGSAAVPGAGLIMLLIILESIGVPSAGLALVLGPDRILDMCRTAVNVTGDATVSMIIATTEGEKLKILEDKKETVEVE